MPRQVVDELTDRAELEFGAGLAQRPSGGVVESRPVGAKVFLDGKGLGVTPLSVPDVAVGSHVVRLEMSGYRRWSASIRVVAGERERVAASLEEETVR